MGKDGLVHNGRRIASGLPRPFPSSRYGRECLLSVLIFFCLASVPACWFGPAEGGSPVFDQSDALVVRVSKAPFAEWLSPDRPTIQRRMDYPGPSCPLIGPPSYLRGRPAQQADVGCYGKNCGRGGALAANSPPPITNQI